MSTGWNITEVAWPVSIAAAVRRFANEDELAWLDGVAGGPPTYSLICTRPVATIEQYEGQPARLATGGRTVAEDESAWRLWRAAQRRLPRRSRLAWAVGPGSVGYLGFELARQLERLPARRHEDLGLPLVRLGLYDRAIVIDHERRAAFAVRAEPSCWPGDAEPEAEWQARWNVAAGGAPIHAPSRLRVYGERSQAAHEEAVRRALAYIAAGDIYQVNIAQRLRLDGVGDPLALFAAVRAANPAPYAALLRWGQRAVASFSPELFLRLDGDAVLTSPIKGTRPRTGDAVLDAAHEAELLASAKEAAELTMIVDLHRNDLGRVCEYGSVRVVCPRRIEAHPTVFHTIADVTGRLRPGCDGIDLLTACFPAGSITGVPKIRAIEIIDELEPVARGAYTGAVGCLGLDGRMTFNVAIRTLQIHGDAATLYVGGGIVADSDPAAEYEETLAKARGILRGVGVARTPRVARRV